MADVLKWFLLIVGVFLVLQSYWLISAALFPALVEKSRERFSRPIQLTGLGLVIVGPLVLLAVFFFQKGNSPIANIIGFAILLAPFLLGFAGSAGLSQKIGEGLPSAGDQAQPWKAVLRGGTVLSLTFLLPFLGWFVILPWTLIAGCAAAVLAIISMRKETAEAAAAATETEPAETEMKKPRSRVAKK